MKTSSISLQQQADQLLKRILDPALFSSAHAIRAFQSEVLRACCLAVICANFGLGFLGSWASYQLYGIVTLMSLCVLLLNKQGHYQIARWVFIFFIHSSIFYLSATDTHLLLPYLMLLIGVAVSCLLFFDDAHKQMPGHILVMLLIFVLFQVTGYTLPVTVTVTDELLNRAFIINMSCLLMSVVLSLLYLVVVYEKSEKHLRRTLKELQIRNQEMDHYVYRVSHDLRAPLCSVIGLTNLAAEEEEPAAMQHYFKMIRNTIQKSDEFIQSVLTHSKAMNAPIEPVPLHLEEFVRNCFQELHYLEAWPHIRLSVEGQTSTPYYGDAFQLSIIFKNLIANAIHFHNPHAAQPHLVCNLNVTEHQALVTLTDNGIGIEPAHLPKIFDMFHRGSERSTGSGLGLYIVRLALEKIAGRISVQSRLGQGTTFEIVFKNYQAEVARRKAK